MSDEIRLWFWIVTDEVTKRRRQTRHRMTEQEAKKRHGADAVKVEGSLEIRHTGRDWHTSRFQQKMPPHFYPADSWGPAAADRLIRIPGNAWVNR